MTMTKQKGFKWVCTLLVCVVSIFSATAVFFTGYSLFFLQPPAQEHSGISTNQLNISLMNVFDDFVSEAMAEAEAAVRAVPKHFSIDPGAKSCPVPNQDCYGQAESAAELQWLLDDAAVLLDGQETVFSVDTPIMEGSVIRYYLDETILAITWKQVFDNFVYTISEIKIQDPSQFRRFIVSDDLNYHRYYQTAQMSEMSNAVIAASADFYKNRPFGIVVYDGMVKRTTRSGFLQTCFIDSKGDLLFTQRGELADGEAVAQYVAEHNVQFSLAFGPVLIDNGEVCVPDSYPLGEISGGYPRSAICQKDTLHYVLVVATAEGPYGSYTNIPRFASNLATFGCIRAYALDGGRTATITMNHQLINNVNYDEPRATGDCIYFGSALPNYSDTQE